MGFMGFGMVFTRFSHLFTSFSWVFLGFLELSDVFGAGTQTMMVPNVYDPSELRSDVNGKVVRYLHDEGTEIAAGVLYTPY